MQIVLEIARAEVGGAIHLITPLVNLFAARSLEPRAKLCPALFFNSLVQVQRVAMVAGYLSLPDHAFFSLYLLGDRPRSLGNAVLSVRSPRPNRSLALGAVV